MLQIHVLWKSKSIDTDKENVNVNTMAGLLTMDTMEENLFLLKLIGKKSFVDCFSMKLFIENIIGNYIIVTIGLCVRA